MAPCGLISIVHGQRYRLCVLFVSYVYIAFHYVPSNAFEKVLPAQFSPQSCMEYVVCINTVSQCPLLVTHEYKFELKQQRLEFSS